MSAPGDNPFGWAALDAKPEIWSSDHRNAQGLRDQSRDRGSLGNRARPARGVKSTSSAKGKKLLAGGDRLWHRLPRREDHDKQGEIRDEAAAVKYGCPRIAPSDGVLHRKNVFRPWKRREELFTGALRQDAGAVFGCDANTVTGEDAAEKYKQTIRDVAPGSGRSAWLLNDSSAGGFCGLPAK